MKPLNTPNILLIVVDQMNANALSAYGHPDVHTPGLDRLAKWGVNFSNAYCSQPICVPSRSSFMTGSLPSTNGVVLNKVQQHGLATQAWMGKLLKDAGYQTAYLGKWHIPMPITESTIHGFSSMQHCKNNGIDDDIVASAKTFLESKQLHPFLLVTSFNNPHNICEWARGESLPDGSLPEPPPIKDCPPLPANHEPMPDEPAFIREFQKKHPRVFPTQDWTAEQWRLYLWAYYRLIEKVDHKIGQVLDALEASEHADNTVILFTSDHGDGAAAHRWNQKSLLFEETIAVPLIVCPPSGYTAATTHRSEFISIGLDLLPTVCDYAGISWEDDSRLSGHSVRQLAEGTETIAWRDHVGIEMTLGAKDKPFGVEGHAIRFEDFKYIEYRMANGQTSELLFDLTEDPGEMCNQAQDRSFSDLLERGRSHLNTWCREHKRAS